MRLTQIVLVSAVALLAGGNSLATAQLNQDEISQVTSPEAVRSIVSAQSYDESKRHLRTDTTEDKTEKTEEEEKGLLGEWLDNAIAKKQYRRWYRSGMNPKEVRSMLKRREADGEYVDWAVANGYPRYYRRRRNRLFYY
ncbi:unnamed protein product [Phytophthora fragariaefolia]|uniref:RxLR effector protein n=1 Tax=Phytophthora fragariaefolia TaxID=1490495 RepID=A0A9W6UDV0_9STRA|nr:unnamed protein product [Phytophthora fragariaefolia]